LTQANLYSLSTVDTALLISHQRSWREQGLHNFRPDRRQFVGYVDWVGPDPLITTVSPA